MVVVTVALAREAVWTNGGGVKCSLATTDAMLKWRLLPFHMNLPMRFCLQGRLGIFVSMVERRFRATWC